MLFWISIAVVTGLTAVILILPLRRVRKPVTDGFAHDAEVYKDQLTELERDEAAGLISAEQAEYARGEIGRRLLAANAKVKKDRSGGKASRGGGRILQAALVLLVPLIAIGLYMKEGAPDVPDQPLEARLANPGNDIALLVAKMERHLAQTPDDGEGWQVIAPIYMRSQRFDDAANAYGNAVRLLPPDSDRYSAFGEAQVAAAKGQVTAEAEAAFSKSLEMNADNPRSAFYLAIGLAQKGEKDKAREAYNALIAKSPADAPWVPAVKQALAELDGVPQNMQAPGNPSAADIAAAEDMSAGDRQDMIRSMVAGLDEKLTENPDNFEGWIRLVRSYVVLKDEAKAKDALKRALVQFPPDKDQGKALLAQAKELGLMIDGVNP